MTYGRLFVNEYPKNMKKKLPKIFVKNVARTKSRNLSFLTKPAA